MLASIAKSVAVRGSKQPVARCMSTIRYTEYGHPFNVLKKEGDDAEGPLGPQQVALKFLAAPINVADLSQIQGAYGIKAKFPAVPGNEGVAVVTAVGSDVKNVQVNDRVIPTQSGFGTWRNKAVAAADDVMKISSKIPVENAATLAVNPATAYRMLQDFVQLQAGDVIIQNGANSAVGQAVIQLAALRGIKTINIIRNDGDYESTHSHLMSLGATVVCIDQYVGSADFKRLIADLPAPKLALNCVGGKTSLEMAKVLAKQGVHVTYGGMSKEAVSVGTGSLIFHDITLRGFWLSEWVKNASQDERKAMLEELASLVEAGKLRTWIETYKFEDFEDALAAAVNRKTKRKIVMKME